MKQKESPGIKKDLECRWRMTVKKIRAKFSGNPVNVIVFMTVSKDFVRFKER
jgi:hypothetical protein